jgi:hypothetical protein
MLLVRQTRRDRRFKYMPLHVYAACLQRLQLQVRCGARVARMHMARPLLTSSRAVGLNSALLHGGLIRIAWLFCAIHLRVNHDDY